jgi:hypothetical protein
MATTVRKLGKAMGEVCWYEVDGQSYYQKTLVLGQSTLLAPFLEGLSFDDLKAESVVGQLGERVGRVLEIVLVPKGVSQQTHAMNLQTPGAIESASFFLSRLTHLDFIQLVDDFFACNLDSSVISQMANALQGMNATKTATETVSNGSALLSPEATQPTEATSLG